MILIVGGGVAGLSAGCYARMNGLDTLILERSESAGGLCTGWQRGPYTFDGCIRWLMGTVPQDRCYQVWRELGVIDACPMIRHSELVRVVGPDGRTLVVHNAIDDLADHLRDLSPGDAPIIDELAREVRAFAEMRIPLTPPRELLGPGRWSRSAARVMPLMRALRRRDDDGSLAGFAARFTDPFLQRALPAVFELRGFSLVTALLVLAGLSNGDGAVPRGGSLALTRALVGRYRELGGEIAYGQAVEEILVEGDRAAGLRLAGGAELPAEVVISAADGRTTLFDMLGGRYLTRELRRWYAEFPPFPPLIQVSLGLDRDLSAEPHASRYLLDEPLSIAGEPCRSLTVRHFCFDPTMAPPGKSVVAVNLSADYDRWRELGRDRSRYDAEKRRVAETALAWLDRVIPNVSAAVEEIDVATPLTYERFTGNWRGSYEGWVPTHHAMGLLIRGEAVRRTLPGLQGFYMAGHWVEPGGGLPSVALSGREVVQLICHDLA